MSSYTERNHFLMHRSFLFRLPTISLSRATSCQLVKRSTNDSSAPAGNVASVCLRLCIPHHHNSSQHLPRALDIKGGWCGGSLPLMPAPPVPSALPRPTSYQAPRSGFLHFLFSLCVPSLIVFGIPLPTLTSLLLTAFARWGI